MNEYYNTNVQNIANIKFKFPTFIVIAGKSECGKTVLCKNIIKNLIDNNEINHIIMYSKTADMTDDYNFIPEKNIIDYDKSEEHINKVFNYQYTRKKHNKKNPKNKKIVENILMIFDDVNVTKKNIELINLATRGRHSNITCILSVQYPKGLLSSSIRGQIKYCFFNDLNAEGEEAIYKTIHIPTKFKLHDFHDFIDEYTIDYQFIMYDNIEKNKRERIKIVKSDLIELEFI